mmetsp:Transcript_29693/g.65575  ORF Transcript_29693/g.65575 Transcript_29693/m.65575 type:complete len:240 (-) Transcript_29693:883-1602(-)
MLVLVLSSESGSCLLLTPLRRLGLPSTVFPSTSFSDLTRLAAFSSTRVAASSICMTDSSTCSSERASSMVSKAIATSTSLPVLFVCIDFGTGEMWIFARIFLFALASPVCIAQCSTCAIGHTALLLGSRTELDSGDAVGVASSACRTTLCEYTAKCSWAAAPESRDSKPTPATGRSSTRSSSPASAVFALASRQLPSACTSPATMTSKVLFRIATRVVFIVPTFPMRLAKLFLSSTHLR